MTMFGSQWLANAGSTYEIEQSIRFNYVDDPSLTIDYGSAGNRRTYTYSVWLKRSNFGSFNMGLFGSGVDTNNRLYLRINTALQFVDVTGGEVPFNVKTNAVLRDCSSWYHVVLAVDTTDATASNRVKIYINGTLQTSLANTSYPSENLETRINSTDDHYISLINNSDGATEFDGYMAEINFIDGTQAAATAFGETNEKGQWVPIKFEGTYGSNGFYLKGQDSSALGDDSSGNGNDWTTSNLAANDQMSDSPTNNHCTWNSLQTGTTISSLTDGNLVATGTSGDAAKWMSLGTLAVNSGKWYYEVTSGGARIGAGFTTSGSLTQANLNTGPVDVAAETFVIQDDGRITYGTTTGNSAPSFGSGVTMGFALDADAGKGWVTVNGSDWADSSGGTTGDPTDGSNPTWTQTIGTPVQPLCGDTSGGSFTTIATANFGASAFAYTPPTGYNAWNTDNLPDPAIEYPPDYFTPYIYTGDNTGTSRAFTGVGFAPNLVWTKARGATYSNALFDTVRGVEKYLSSDGTGAEINQPSSGYITAFGSDGYTFSDGSSNRNNYNADTTYVSWNWAEGSTPGFDIVSYTGTGANRTVAHNLGVKPGMFIVKQRGASGSNWGVYHSGVGATKSLFLQSTEAAFDSAEYFNDTEPTASVFTLGTNAQGNADGGTYIAYVFAPVEGFSKFGSYIGNGSSSGPMVNLGFQPAWYLVKLASAANQSWYLFDDQRDPFNFVRRYLGPNRNNAEVAGIAADISHDFLSNGIKIRTDNGLANTDGAEYVYAAFAKTPFKTANAR